MSDLEPAVRAFVESADAVYEDYDQGYVDADVALSVLEGHVEDLRDELD